MPRELTEELAKIASLRNILVYRFLEVYLNKLYEASRRIVPEINDILTWKKENC